jgi:autoinducer 2-degrading protein
MKALVVTIDVKPEHREAFIEELIKNAVGSEEREPGCLVFNVAQDSANPDVMHLFEVYRDQEAVDIHMKAPHVLRFLEATTDWIARPIGVIDCDTVYPRQREKSPAR